MKSSKQIQTGKYNHEVRNGRMLELVLNMNIEELKEAILNGDIVINFGKRVIDAKAIEEYLREIEKYSLESKSNCSFEFVIEG